MGGARGLLRYEGSNNWNRASWRWLTLVSPGLAATCWSNWWGHSFSAGSVQLYFGCGAILQVQNARNRHKMTEKCHECSTTKMFRKSGCKIKHINQWIKKTADCAHQQVVKLMSFTLPWPSTPSGTQAVCFRCCTWRVLTVKSAQTVQNWQVVKLDFRMGQTSLVSTTPGLQSKKTTATEEFRPGSETHQVGLMWFSKNEIFWRAFYRSLLVKCPWRDTVTRPASEAFLIICELCHTRNFSRIMRWYLLVHV